MWLIDFFTKVPRKFNTESITFSVSSGRTTRYTNDKKKKKFSFHHTLFTIITSWSITVINVIESESRSVSVHSSRLHGLYSPWNSPSQNTGVGSLSLLQINVITKIIKLLTQNMEEICFVFGDYANFLG